MKWLSYTKREIGDLLISCLILGFSFMILLLGASFVNYLIALGLAIICFIPREMLQRWYSRRLAMYSEYQIWIPGVISSILSSFIGFVFAAPGKLNFSLKYYERYGRKTVAITTKQIGMVLMSGIWFSVGFGILSMLISLGGNPIFSVLAKMNFYIAFFNLIPIADLDGVKLIRWRPALWLFFLISTFGLLICSHFIG